MQRKNIIIITDCTDVAYNELYQTIYKNLPENIRPYVDISPLAPVKNFSIENAAFVIRLLADIVSENTIFHVVVNGTNKNPERIFGKTKHGLTFIGNNSGYFNWMLEDFGLDKLYRNQQDRKKNSKSFGGKQVGAPTAAKIASGIPFTELGEEVGTEFLSDFTITPGTVVHCDNFGLIKIKHPKLQLEEGQKLKIFVNGKPCVNAIFSTKWKTQPDGTWVLFPGSSLNSIPELGKIRVQNSAGEIGVKEGDIITWKLI